MWYPTAGELLAIHLFAIDFYFGRQEGERAIQGAPDPDLLASAVGLPLQTFDGQDLYRDLFWKAAALFRSITKNHAFLDGNKRTACVALLIFLDLNGYGLACSDDELLAFALKLAKRKRHSLRKIRGWIKKRCSKRDSVRAGRRKQLHVLAIVLRTVRSITKSREDGAGKNTQ